MNQIRVAEVTGGLNATQENIRDYLPINFNVTKIYSPSGDRLLIVGQDFAGWTMDGYVIPRLASGLIAVKEIDSLNLGRVF